MIEWGEFEQKKSEFTRNFYERSAKMTRNLIRDDKAKYFEMIFGVVK